MKSSTNVSKFKTGDRVVMVKPRSGNESASYLKRGTLTDVDNTFVWGIFDEGIDKTFSVYHFRVELEEIYDSPLYQALL